MAKLEGFMAGVNLGGWISQYKKYSHEHFKTFITEKDIAIIAGWGMDHVRVPFDYPILEEDDNPGVYLDSGWGYLDNCLTWCKAHGLNVMLDMHKAPGYAFGTLDSNSLFTDEKMQQRFLDLWQTIAKRYEGEGDYLVYELLNEIVEPGPDRWNALAIKAVAAIRAVDTKHRIVIGGNHYNAVTCLKEIPLFDDPKIIYTYHMYAPGMLTHQFAEWGQHPDYNAQKAYYPYDLQFYIDLDKKFGRAADPEFYEGVTGMNKTYLAKVNQPAFDFQAEHPELPVYCGEFGVIEHADMGSRENWHIDLCELLLEHDIGHAVWSYKGMGFPMIDKQDRPVSDKLVAACSRKAL